MVQKRNLIESGQTITSGSTLDLTGATGGTTHISAATVALSETITAVNDAPVRTAGSVSPLTVNEDAAITSLGLGSVAYGPGGGADEAGQTLTYTVTGVPLASLGNVTLADGTTVVTTGTYTLAQIQGMKFIGAANANGGNGIEQQQRNQPRRRPLWELDVQKSVDHRHQERDVR